MILERQLVILLEPDVNFPRHLYVPFTDVTFLVLYGDGKGSHAAGGCLLFLILRTLPFLFSTLSFLLLLSRLSF